MKFCDKLPKQRKNNNLSQEQLADKLGVSRQAVSKWESGSSYPDMDKILQICKVLNCTLEDLLDDGAVGNQTKEKKINFNTYLQDFLKFVTKTYNMFSSMTFKEKMKCIFEIGLLVLLLYIIGGIFFSIINSITYELLDLIPYDFKFTILGVFEVLYETIFVILGIIVLIHLFKIRYLDYFIIVEDSNASTKSIEEEVDNKKDNKLSKEKVIIRDPKHSTFSLFNLLGKLIILCIKFFAVMFAVPVIFFFVGFIVFAVISLCHIQYGIIFLFFTLGLLSLGSLCLVILYFIYNFIFNRTIKFKNAFYMIIISLVILGVSIGLSFVGFLSYKEVSSLEKADTYEVHEEFTVTDNTYLYLGFNTEGNVSYTIDNSLDKVMLDIETIKGFNYTLDTETSDTSINYYLHQDSSFINAYNVLINDLKKNRIRDYNSNNVKLKITLSQKDYDILHRNHDQISM